MSSPRSAATAKKRAASAPVAAVEEQEEKSPEVQALFALEQAKVNDAALQGQLNYLSARVAALVQENYELKQKLGEE